MKHFLIPALFLSAFLNACSPPEAEKSSEQTPDAAVPEPAANPTAASKAEVMNHVTVGEADWSVANSATPRFADGTEIPRADDLTAFAELGEMRSPAWCYPDFDPDKGETYGKLYNWYAVTDPRGLCPAGWRVANEEDWAALTEIAGGQGVAGTTLKSVYGWFGGEDGSDAFGFSALPAGAVSALNGYSAEGKVAAFWSTEEASANYAEYRVIHALRSGIFLNEDLKMTGMSVRCVRE